MLRKYPRSSATLLTLLGAGATATALRKAKAHATSEGIDNKYWVVEKPFKFLSGITPDLIKKTGANAYNDLVDFLKLPVDKPQASEQEAPVQVPVQAGVRASRPLG
jgi:hypothetical protein